MAADLHLDGESAGRRRLAALLGRAQAERLPIFLLGDLFHYWFGRRHLQLPMYEDELELLRAHCATGGAIYLLPGNRDFLLGSSFATATGVWVGGDELIRRVGTGSVLFCHGDLFATSDLNYQALRRLIRCRPVRWLADALPRAVVDRIARRLRQASAALVAEKSATTLAPDLGAVARHFQAGIDVVVCGHFHARADLVFAPSAGGGRLCVLEAFEARGYYLQYDGADWREHWIDECAERDSSRG
ncbi:MAG: UDP-2,3-diacylglucosamine diphosphatase [Planctomycetota bacterium]